MAGLSSRFTKAGYDKPKYMLEAHGATLFSHSVSSFKNYFDTEFFLFILRDIKGTAKFVESELNKLSVKNYKVVILEEETRGQAETVAKGLEMTMRDTGILDFPITVFNIDTIRPDFIFPNLELLGDGYLEVFKGAGDNWSFAKPLDDKSTLVAETAEKTPISNLCSTGLYYFKSASSFLDVYLKYISKSESDWSKGELFIAPLYNLLIESNMNIHYHLIETKQVIFCGVPGEYLDFCRSK